MISIFIYTWKIDHYYSTLIVSFVIYEESINEQYAIQFVRPLFDK